MGSGGCGSGAAPAFSQRTASIDESSHRLVGGRGSPGVRRVAYLADRPDKDREVSADDLRSAWTRRAVSLGLDVNDLVSAVGRAAQTDRGEEPGVGRVVEGLVRTGPARGHLAARDHVVAVADAAPQGLAGRDVVRIADAVGSALGARPVDDGPRSTGRGSVTPAGAGASHRQRIETSSWRTRTPEIDGPGHRRPRRQAPGCSRAASAVRARSVRTHHPMSSGGGSGAPVIAGPGPPSAPARQRPGPSRMRGARSADGRGGPSRARSGVRRRRHGSATWAGASGNQAGLVTCAERQGVAGATAVMSSGAAGAATGSRTARPSGSVHARAGP